MHELLPTEDELLFELARLRRLVEAKTKRQQQGELFDRVDQCVEHLKNGHSRKPITETGLSRQAVLRNSNQKGDQ